MAIDGRSMRAITADSKRNLFGKEWKRPRCFFQRRVTGASGLFTLRPASTCRTVYFECLLPTESGRVHETKPQSERRQDYDTIDLEQSAASDVYLLP